MPRRSGSDWLEISHSALTYYKVQDHQCVCLSRLLSLSDVWREHLHALYRVCVSVTASNHAYRHLIIFTPHQCRIHVRDDSNYNYQDDLILIAHCPSCDWFICLFQLCLHSICGDPRPLNHDWLFHAWLKTSAFITLLKFNKAPKQLPASSYRAHWVYPKLTLLVRWLY